MKNIKKLLAFVAVFAIVLMGGGILTLTACQPATYTLTYAAGEGSGAAPAAESYAEGAEVIIKANPFTAPQGKEFNGWSDGSKTYKAGDKLTMPKANVTLTAQWKTSEKPITEYWTVTFKNGDTVEKTVQVVKGQKLTAEQIPAAPTIADDKEFKGWFDGETQITVDTVISGNITAIAKIDNKPTPQPGYWTVTFKSGTTTVKTVQVEKGQKLTADQLPPDPVGLPSHLEFKGWFDGDTKIDENTTISSDVTAIAKVVDNTPPAPFTNWWVDSTTAIKAADSSDYLVSVTLKGAMASISCGADFAADSATNGYIAVKYSGTATFGELSIYGTKDGGEVKSGVVANIAGSGWNVTKTVGSDFSVVVAQIGGYYGAGELNIDTITNVGFNLTGEGDQTFTVLGIEFLANANHNFGTPTPPVVEPGELTIGDLVPGWDGNGYTVTKDGNDQTVSFSSHRGYELVKSEITHYTEDMAFLYLNVTLNDDINLGVYAGSISLYEHVKVARGNKQIAIPLTGKNLGSSFILNFYFNAVSNPGAEYSEENPKTVVFHEISFSETDPTVSADPNHFRTPVGMSGVNYSESDKKITYTNTTTDHYRYLEILLDNHDVAYDVLVINITGYNGLRLGVRALYNDEIEGVVTAATSDLIYSGSYYSEIKTDEATEILLYFGANGLKGRVVTGIQLYFDVLADAGKEGEVELTLNGISLLKSADLNLSDTTIEAQDVTIAVGETPDFHAVLKSGENTIEGTIITEYRLAGSTANYEAGLPATAGTYEVRFYYMGSREYNYSRTTTVTLTVTEA